MNRNILHRAFEVGVGLKAVNAALECAGGFALYFVSTQRIADIVRLLTQSELSANPHDRVAQHLMAMADGLSLGTKNFYAFYLLVHGLVKLALAAGLLAGKLWAYPASIAAFALFIAYQLYRYSYTHSAGLLVLTVLDVVLLWLVWQEWQTVQRHRQGSVK
ncbi:DUF2127 domain-containing protein [Aestuariivirga sp.]|uniref:DUF2127 domain-containing protein n=1 Tax=Aestuariivirga sp. TaxID=2650926 RepID=UPI0039E2BD96